MQVSELRSRFPHTWPVFPVDEEGYCTCWDGITCRRAGKHADPKAPETGPYAVLAGPGGVLIVDVDVKGKEDGFAQLESWKLPSTLEVHTPSGGMHLYYNHPGIELTNKKLASAIDVRANPRNEGGHSYVIGPGSPGYEKVPGDPYRVTPSDAYEIASDSKIANAPETLIGFLSVGAKDVGSPVTPIDDNHPAWNLCCQRAEEDCKKYPPSIEGQQASSEGLMPVVRRLARDWQLPNDKALELLNQYWNTRCVMSDGVTPYPWDQEDLIRALDRSRSNGPGEGRADELLARAEGLDIAHKARSHSRSAKLEKLKANVAAHIEGKIPRKTKKNLEHKYEHKIGDAIRKSDTRSAGEVLHMLTTNIRWAGVLQFDSLRERIIAVDPPINLEAECGELTDEDVMAIRYWFECHGMLVSKDTTWDAVKKASKCQMFNPLTDYLSSLPASEGAIDGLCSALGQVDELTKSYVRKTLIAAVRRATAPGCKVDTMLTLLGAPGVRKSSFVAALFGQEWIAESLPDLSDEKKCGEVMAGRWAVEIAELASVFAARQRDTSIAFLTRTVDTFRGAYARGNAKPRPRSCVFVGTVNDQEILRDTHKADVRRLWIIEVGRIDTDWVTANRDRVWSEAFAAASTGEPHWLSEEEEREHEERSKNFEAGDDLSEYVAGYCKGRSEVKGADVYMKAIGGELKDYKAGEMKRMGDMLRKLGCIYLTRRCVWAVPERLAQVEGKVSTLRKVKG